MDEVWTKLADDVAPKADGDGVRAGARLELGEQVPNVRLHGFLGQEQALADLPVHESVRDELEHLDLPHRRLLFELPKRVLKRDHVGTAGTATSCRNFLEAARVRQIAAEDLLALRSIHAPSIGAPSEAL